MHQKVKNQISLKHYTQRKTWQLFNKIYMKDKPFKKFSAYAQLYELPDISIPDNLWITDCYVQIQI